MEIYGFLKNVSTEQLYNIFLQNTYNWYDAISTKNPFKRLKRALESKLSNFKIFKNC